LKDLLAIDVGGGTQDILLWREDVEMENCVKLVLPAWTCVIAGQVREATQAGQPIYLDGRLMGGGACSRAIEDHRRQGLRIYASPEAALTLHDNLNRVRDMGVEIRDDPVDGARIIRMRDVDLVLLARCLERYGVSMPSAFAVAVQDHGHSPDGSNRKFRFHHWEEFIMSGGLLRDTAYLQPPRYMTRMRAVQRDAPGAMVMDTCIAAIRGALLDEETRRHRDTGLMVANVGNHHVTAALMREDRVWGIMEHHTGLLDGVKIRKLLERFLLGRLTDQEVFEDSGHGCLVHPDFRGFQGEPFVSATGPRRAMVKGSGVHFAAPFGDMMLTGCFGLLDAALSIQHKSLNQVKQADSQMPTVA